MAQHKNFKTEASQIQIRTITSAAVLKKGYMVKIKNKAQFFEILSISHLHEKPSFLEHLFGRVEGGK